MNYSRRNAQDSYDTLCRIYGEHNAGMLMHIHGACMPVVSEIALAIERSPKAVAAAKGYRTLASMNEGYRRLIFASGNDGSVKRIVEYAMRRYVGNRFRKDWAVDCAVTVALALIDRKGR